MAAGSGWTVTSQLTDQIENTNAGQTVVGVRVYFLTGNGNEGSIFIPNTQYTAANVRKMVADKAALVDSVGNLSDGL